MGPGRPTVVTTTTTTTSPAYSLDWIKLDLEHFKTVPGILKLVQWFLGILCMAFGSPSYSGGGDVFLFVVVLCFVITFFWICIYFFSIREGLQLPIPWIIPEFYYTGGASLFYFIAFIVKFATYRFGSHIVAAIFGMFNTVAYALGTFFLYKDWRQNAVGANSPNV